VLRCSGHPPSPRLSSSPKAGERRHARQPVSGHNRVMRMTYDREVNAFYLRLTDEQLPPGRDSVPVSSPDGTQAWVVMDWRDGKIVGLEVLDARERLHPDLLAQAEIIA
jgi:uncharacterized protein YuzE